MIKLKSLNLKYYCGYRSIDLNFTENNATKSLICFYGPNGVGKSNMLKSICSISNVYRYFGRDISLLFRKSIYNKDYNPSYMGYFEGNLNDLEMRATYETDMGDKEVVIGVVEIDETKAKEIGINQGKSIRKKIIGVKKNELPRKQSMSYYYSIDADHPNSMYKFQLHSEMKDVFLDLAEAVYGMKCKMGCDISDLKDAEEEFFTDFYIEKYGTKVHFKRMSDGEKKIATLLRDLCNPTYMNDSDIVLIDNVCMHIYKDRHAILINKIKEHFPNKQFFITTHSPILVGMKDENLGIKIPPYLDSGALFNLEEYKKAEMSRMY